MCHSAYLDLTMGERIDTPLSNKLIVEIKEYCKKHNVSIFEFMTQAVELRLGKLKIDTQPHTKGGS